MQWQRTRVCLWSVVFVYKKCTERPVFLERGRLKQHEADRLLMVYSFDFVLGTELWLLLLCVAFLLFARWVLMTLSFQTTVNLCILLPTTVFPIGTEPCWTVAARGKSPQPLLVLGLGGRKGPVTLLLAAAAPSLSGGRESRGTSWSPNAAVSQLLSVTATRLASVFDRECSRRSELVRRWENRSSATKKRLLWTAELVPPKRQKPHCFNVNFHEHSRT